MYFTALILVLGGIVMLVIGVKTRADKIGPNELVGLRIRATSLSDRAWYAGQRESSPWMTAGGAVLIVAGVVGAFTNDAAAAVIALVAAVVVLTLAVVSIVRGGRAAQAAHERETPRPR